MASTFLRSGGALVGSLLLVVAAHVAFHESLHVGINWLLAGHLANRCGPVSVVVGRGWRYLAVCYASGGAAGVNVAATLALSGRYGGAVAVGVDRRIEDLPARTGCVVGATCSTLHLGAYLSNTGALAPESTVPTDSATVIGTLGVGWLLPAVVALLLSTVAVAHAWWRLWPPVRAVVYDGTYATDGGRSRSE